METRLPHTPNHEPLVVFRLNISTKRSHRAARVLRVVIWEQVGDLRKNAKQHDRSLNWSDAAGCYLSLHGNLVFGEIHLWKKLIDRGYFAHELQHFINDYAMETEQFPLDFDANERMAYLAGESTKDFWNKYYEWSGVNGNG